MQIENTARLRERFEAKVDRSGACHLWTGSQPQGYGLIQVKIDGKWSAQVASRVAWFLHTGVWPVLHVLHRCDNPPCVNPAHLFVGTHADNVADMNAKGRHGRIRLPERVVAAIRSSGGAQRAVAERFSVSQSTVWRIRHGKQRAS
jgi:hypothetical protein